MSETEIDATNIFGPLVGFMVDPTIEEVWINSPERIFVARSGRSELTMLLLSAEQVRNLVERLLLWSGRRLDLSVPFVDARLPDGSRLHVAIPEITPQHWAVNIRKHLLQKISLAQLAERAVMTSEMAEMLRRSVSAVIVAQRSLVQATESAAQSAAHALDLDTYYQGKHSALSFLVNDASPIIPIDCQAASSRATETLEDIANTESRNYGGPNKHLVRRELSNVRISEFQCNGTEVLITASAKAWLPISLSLFSFESVDLSASAGTTSVKKRVLSIFGINF